MLSQKQKILIVDDQPGSVRVLNELFCDDYQVFFATDGAAAIALANTELPDLILLDIIMPGMNGREVCTLLKANPRTQGIPIIFVTVMSSDWDEKAGFELGAADYIVKPINATAVKLRVKNQLELKQHRDRLEELVKQRTVELIRARDEAREREQEANEREQLLWTILESSLDAFIMTNHEGKVMDFNPASEALFGYKRADVVGQDIAQFIIPPETRDKHRHALRKDQSGGVDGWTPIRRRMVAEGVRADGKKVDLEIAISSVLSYGRPVYTGFLRDITSSKQLLVALNAALTVAESSFRAKDLFLANMSHEIRTPMNGVLGMIDLALRAELSAKTRGFLVHAKASSHILLRVINDILDFSKIEAGKMAMERVDFNLGDILDASINLFRSTVTRQDVELIVFPPPRSIGTLVGDALRIQQVLINLTGNAIKFTKAGEIGIKVVVVEETVEEVSLEFSVRDTGIGLSEAHVARLFSPFVQAESDTARKFGGTGLGLTICKRLVEMMGGTVWVESTLDVGSTFFFTVVVGRNRDVEPPEPVVSGAMRRRVTLVVDDNDHARAVTVALLEDLGMEAVAVTSGPDALEALRSADKKGQPYASVLLDGGMPEMDGFKTAEIMLDAALASPPKIILMTPFAEDDRVQQAKRAGVDAFLCKPVTSALLLETLSDVHGETVPQGDGAREEGVDEALLSRTLGGARVLLVDDNLINLDVAKEILGSVGVRVTLAKDGQEAVDAVQTAPFDLVLMDVQMPVMDGYTATRTLRGMDRFKDLPIIAMTANAQVEDQQKCRASGMNDYVSKPIDVGQFFAALSRWIKPVGERLSEGVAEDRGAVGRGEADRAAGGDASERSRDAGEDIIFPEDFQGIDWDEALRRVMGNRALLKKVVLRFAEANGAVDTQLRARLAEGDFEGAASMVHAMKGTSGNIAAVRLHERSKSVEQAIQERALEKLEGLLEAFSQALQEVVAVAGRLTDTPLSSGEAASMEGDGGGDMGGEGAAFPAHLQEDFRHLSALLVAQNLDAEEALVTIAEVLSGQGVTQELAELKATVEGYEFLEADTRLRRLAEKLGIVM